MNVIFLYLSGIFIVLLLILIPMCMKFKARWLRGLASCWLSIGGYADYVCTVRTGGPACPARFCAVGRSRMCRPVLPFRTVNVM